MSEKQVQKIVLRLLVQKAEPTTIGNDATQNGPASPKWVDN